MTKRQRATVIVPTPQGILLTETHRGLVLLPGGGMERGELPIAAAVRELHEETGLVTQAIHFVYQIESQSNLHHVFVVSAYTGTPRPLDDAKLLHYQTKDDTSEGRFPEKASPATVEILKTYYDMLLGTGQLNGELD